MGNLKGRGNQYIQFVRVLYCKLPTSGKQLPAFPLEAVPECFSKIIHNVGFLCSTCFEIHSRLVLLVYISPKVISSGNLSCACNNPIPEIISSDTAITLTFSCVAFWHIHTTSCFYL